MTRALSAEYSDFLLDLGELPQLPDGVCYLNPYTDKRVISFVRDFYRKFYSDQNQRILVLGINPGRFGGGQTGISFTDPVALSEYCGIENDLSSRRELSSTFIYEFISSFGGPASFYAKYLIGSVCPLGFLSLGKNVNYYDSKELYQSLQVFINTSFKKMCSMNFSREHLVVFGKKNLRFVQELNAGSKDHFRNIHVLDHPRYILQYKRKRVGEYIEKWNELFGSL